MRSGEMFSSKTGAGWGLFFEGVRVGCWERPEGPPAGWEARERPLRLDKGLDFLREEDFERVTGIYFFRSILQVYAPIPIPPSKSAAPITPSNGDGPLLGVVAAVVPLGCAPKLTDI